MGISVEATETKATLLLAELRRCLGVGDQLGGRYIKDLIAQLESATTSNLSSRTNILADNLLDGRNTVEAAAISGGIANEATEATAVALLTECRRCLAYGVNLAPLYMKNAIAQLESFTVDNTSGRTDKAPDNALDGRNAVEAAVIA